MIFNQLHVHEIICLHNATTLEFYLCTLIHWIQCSICSHDLHHVIWILHAKYMISHPIFHFIHCINIYRLLQSKVSINGITLDILRPIYALLNERIFKYSFLLELHQNFCNTEATIHNNHLCTFPNRPCAPQHCSHCSANITKLRYSVLTRELPTFHYLCKPYYCQKPTSNGIPLIPKGARFTAKIHPIRTSILNNQFLHALI